MFQDQIWTYVTVNFGSVLTPQTGSILYGHFLNQARHFLKKLANRGDPPSFDNEGEVRELRLRNSSVCTDTPLGWNRVPKLNDIFWILSPKARMTRAPCSKGSRTSLEISLQDHLRSSWMPLLAARRGCMRALVVCSQAGNGRRGHHKRFFCSM